MSSEPVTRPRPRRILLAGMIALAVAGTVAADGLVSRARSKQELAQWTSAPYA